MRPIYCRSLPLRPTAECDCHECRPVPEKETKE